MVLNAEPIARQQQIGDGHLAVCAHIFWRRQRKRMRDLVALRKVLVIAQLGLRGRAKAETIARQDKSTRHHGARGSWSAQGLTRHAFFDAPCRGFWRTAPALAKRRAVYAGLRWTTPDLSFRVTPYCAECARLCCAATCNRCRGRSGPANGSNATRLRPLRVRRPTGANGQLRSLHVALYTVVRSRNRPTVVDPA